MNKLGKRGASPSSISVNAQSVNSSNRLLLSLSRQITKVRNTGTKDSASK